MNQDGTRKLSAAREQASAAFSAAIGEMSSLPIGAERSQHLRGIATLLVGQPEEFRATAVSQCPELQAAEPFPDTLLDTEEQKLVSHLTQSDLKVIDTALLNNSVSSWRKAPRVIGSAMVALEGQFQRLPLGLYVRRICALVEGGKLLARGNVEFMRMTEVRLPGIKEGVA